MTSAVEHHRVLRRLEYLRDHMGVDVVFLPVDGQGQLDLDQLAEAITPETALVSLMGANNETGVMWPIEKIAAMVKERARSSTATPCRWPARSPFPSSRCRWIT